MNTHRAYANADTLITCWSRDVDGRVDRSGDTLTAYLTPYGSNIEITEGIDVTGTSLGKMTFTVTTDYIEANLLPGAYRLSIRDDADVQVYAGLLEVV
jgi:hypothetical protein